MYSPGVSQLGTMDKACICAAAVICMILPQLSPGL